MNVFTFTGRLGRDAETRYTKSGTACCSFSVAVDSGYGDNKKTTWLRCTIFGKRAEGGLVQYLKKGVQVAVSGELTVSEYQSQGATRTSVDVNVSTIDLIGCNSSSNHSNTSESAQKNSEVEDDLPF